MYKISMCLVQAGKISLFAISVYFFIIIYKFYCIFDIIYESPYTIHQTFTFIYNIFNKKFLILAK